MAKIKIDYNLTKKFFSIGETSKLVSVDQHVLRFWESKFLQINPIRKAGNRRYYRKEDIEFLLKVKELLYDKGLSIKGVQKLLKNKSKTVFEEEPEFNLSHKDFPTLSENIVITRSLVSKLLNELKGIKESIKDYIIKS